MKTAACLFLLAFPIYSFGQCAGEVCTLEARFPQMAGFKTAPLIAGDELVLEAGVRVLDSADLPGEVSNLGRTTDIGQQAVLGGVYAAETLYLRGGSQVKDRLVAQQVNLGAHVSRPARTLEPDSRVVVAKWRVKRPRSAGVDVILEKGTRRLLSPGAYRRIEVRAGATLALITGTYNFDDLITQSGAKIHFANDDGTVVVHVMRQIAHGGAFSFSAESSDVLVTYFGRQDIEVTGQFDGSLMAPWARVALHSVKNEIHSGMFYARQLRANAGAVIRKFTVSGRGPAIQAMKAELSVDPPLNESATTASTEIEVDVFPDTPTGRMLNRHFVVMYGYGPNAQAQYEASLEELRRHVEQVVPMLTSAYEALPESLEQQQRRWSMVAILSDMEHDMAYEPLRSIAYSEINAELAAMPGDGRHQPTRYEEMIRTLAVDGIGRIAKSGNEKATSALLDLAMHGGPATQRYAAVHFLASGNREERMATLRSSLPPERQYLTRLETDISKLPPLPPP